MHIREDQSMKLSLAKICNECQKKNANCFRKSQMIEVDHEISFLFPPSKRVLFTETKCRVLFNLTEGDSDNSPNARILTV